MKRIGVIAAAAVAAVVVSSGSASSAPAAHGSTCSWGASSITAEVVDGKVVQTAPVRTGCAP